MKTRIDAGTDVAMIGAWDASRKDTALPKVPFKQIMNTLHEDVQAGHLFLIHTGADGGGPIDIYVEEPVPESTLKQTRRAEGEFLIRIPSGRLVVGGAEDYRVPEPRITDENGVVLLFPLLGFLIGWKVALAVTVVVLVGRFYFRQTFFLKRFARYQHIYKTVDEFWKRAQESAPPTFILELDRVTPGNDLKGGEIKV